ncbi:TPA: tetracycline resistance efflux system leader peptide [Bacillus pseudomycoides]|nr:tetracycline resistance efflux system leader peptide [Bacillus pseudomycoides]
MKCKKMTRVQIQGDNVSLTL